MAKRAGPTVWEDGSSASGSSKRPRAHPTAWNDSLVPIPFDHEPEEEDQGVYLKEASFNADLIQEAYAAARSSNLPDSPGLLGRAGLRSPMDNNAAQDGHEAAAHSIVCMGMIPQIHCQRLIKGQLGVQSAVVPDQDYARLNHRFTKGRLLLETEHAPRLVQANAKATAVIEGLYKLANVSATFYVSRQSLLKFLEETASNSDGCRQKRLPIEVNIFGPQSLCADVGTILSDQAMFLQDPIWRDDTFSYDNPHLLKLANADDVEVWFQELLLDSELHNKYSAQGTDWDLALDGLSIEQTNVAAVEDREPDEVLETELMPHQIAARKFMSSRESGQLTNEHRFWQLDRSEGGSSVYRHTITAEESNYPQQEPLGGILADDMGLGKTLSTISLIATSLDRARRFARYNQPGLRDAPQPPFAKATLVVVPSTLLMDGWVKELEKHVAKDTLKIAIYHGHSRVRSFEQLLQYDVVLTTYGTISTEYRRTRRHVLYYLKWFRIVLDEAHFIRSRTTQQFKAVMLLDAQHCWCLTGTPIQNRVEDLGSLLEFCRVPLLQDSKTFHRFLTKVHRESPRRGVRVVRDTLSVMCLRRTKRLLDLSPAKMVEHRVHFSASERQRYNEYYRKRRNAMNDAVSGKMQTSKRLSPLELLLRLRIFCNQGTFTPLDEEGETPELDADETFTLLEEREAAFCAVCFTSIKLVNQLQDSESGIVGECSDVLCRTCYTEARTPDATNSAYKCPVCENVTQLQVLDSEMNLLSQTHNVMQSSKLECLIQDLLQTREHEKSIVFSQWRKTLNITSDLCTANSISHVSIDGATPQAERIRALERFANDPTIAVILMTLGTGAQGLNITAASRIHILEPQWNPAVEAQAIGRAVRIGQEKSATVVRYLVEDSVDMYIQAKQRKKTELASGGFSET